MARRIYKSKELRNNQALDMEMNVKFSKGYRYIKEKYPDCEELANAIKLVEAYTKKLKLFGLHDNQVRVNDFSKSRLIYHTLILIIRITISLTLVLYK